MPTLREHLLNQLYQHNQTRRENGYDEKDSQHRGTLASDIKLRKDLEISSKAVKSAKARQKMVKKNGSHGSSAEKGRNGSDQTSNQ